mmetsp:Transcript_59048/g.141025  ORF Transcript_59048/g.141025 Transcript_59048/m.141025 type:complete len:288 (-) Transcript_59048:126-989(-)
MDLLEFEFGLNAIASGGFVLNCQERIGLESGLTILKSQEQLDSVYFWGKLFGQTKDYYIAYSLSDAAFEFPVKTFYFATDEFAFQKLDKLTEEVADKVNELALEKAFVGDPEALLVPPVEGEGEEPPADEEGQEGEPVKEEGLKLKELHRLAQVVFEIDFDTSVVPKGAYALNEDHKVVPSSDFRGLTYNKATSAEKYVHFRTPTSVNALRAMARSDIHFYADFLDPIYSDLPQNCWVVRKEPTGALVTLRSLCWPGYVAYHAPNTTKFGGLYVGYGQRCRDLPFIL